MKDVLEYWRDSQIEHPMDAPEENDAPTLGEWFFAIAFILAVVGIVIASCPLTR